MKNGDKQTASGKKKSGDKADEKVITISAADTDVDKYTNIRRILGTLDRFLTKRFLFIVALCTGIMSVCVICLSLTNVTSGQAFAPGANSTSRSGDLTLSTWLWSIIVVCAFIAIMTSVYAWGRKKNQAK